jgi:hypothetical protein
MTVLQEPLSSIINVMAKIMIVTSAQMKVISLSIRLVAKVYVQLRGAVYVSVVNSQIPVYPALL